MTEEYLLVYNIPELQSCTSAPPTDPPLHPAIHMISHETGGICHGISLPVADHICTNIVFFTGKTIYGIRVPHDENSTPVVSTLYLFKERKSFSACIGLRRTMVRYLRTFAYALSYASPCLAPALELSSIGTAAQPRSIPSSGRSNHSPLMDEGSGRVIIRLESREGILVLDFALYCKFPSIASTLYTPGINADGK